MALDSNERQNQDYYYYESIILMWLCISENGISKPKFFKSDLGIKGDTYSTQYIPEVKKLIQKYHSEDKVLF